MAPTEVPYTEDDLALPVLRHLRAHPGLTARALGRIFRGRRGQVSTLVAHLRTMRHLGLVDIEVRSVSMRSQTAEITYLATPRGAAFLDMIDAGG